MFSVHIRMTARPGKRDELVERLTAFGRMIGERDGLVILGISRALDDPDAVLVTHIWTDRTTHDTTTALEPVRTETAKIMNLLATPPTHDYAEIAHLRIT